MQDISERERQNINAIFDRVVDWRDQTFPNPPIPKCGMLHVYPSHVGVPVLIIGERPGRGLNGNLREAYPYPENNAQHFLYSSMHRYACTAYAFFNKAGRSKCLRYAQSTDMNFFPDTLGWTRQQRAHGRVLCRTAVDELIETLAPRRILLNGLRTARSYLGQHDVAYGPVGNNGRNNIPAFACPHFSRRPERGDNDPDEVWLPLIRSLRRFLPCRLERDLY